MSKNNRRNTEKKGSSIATYGTIAGLGIVAAATGAALLGNYHRKKREQIETVNRQEYPESPYSANEEILEELKNKSIRDEDENDETRACIICFDKKRKVLFLPCEHMISCVGCAISVFSNENECPQCREIVNKIHVIY